MLYINAKRKYFALTIIFLQVTSSLTALFLNAVSENLRWKSVASVCLQRDVAMSYKIKYYKPADCCLKLVLYSDPQWQRMLELQAVPIMRSRSKFGNNPSIYATNPTSQTTSLKQYSRGRYVEPPIYENEMLNASKALHRLGSSLLQETHKKMASYQTCNQVYKNMLKFLHPSQIVDLQGCHDGQLAWGSWARTCEGKIIPQREIKLPGLTATQSWYGIGEIPEGNPAFEKWKPNTWHVAVLNCPKPGLLKMNYDISFDYVEINRTHDNKDNFPALKRKCSQILRKKGESSFVKLKPYLWTYTIVVLISYFIL